MRGAERNILRSGSSSGSEFASLRTVLRLRSRWWFAAPSSPRRWASSAAVARTRQSANGVSHPSIAENAFVMQSCARSRSRRASAILAFASQASACQVRSAVAHATARKASPARDSRCRRAGHPARRRSTSTTRSTDSPSTSASPTRTRRAAPSWGSTCRTRSPRSHWRRGRNRRTTARRRTRTSTST